MPIILLDASSRLHLAFPAGLPMIFTRIGVAGHHNDICLGNLHSRHMMMTGLFVNRRELLFLLFITRPALVLPVQQAVT
jgi:hypothetical protein